MLSLIFCVCVCVSSSAGPRQLHLNSIERDAYEVVKGPSPPQNWESPSPAEPVNPDCRQYCHIVENNCRKYKRKAAPKPHRIESRPRRRMNAIEMGIDFQFSRLPGRKHRRASLSLRLTWRILDYN